ncbi:MAG: hydrogenase iron-sulfur subunit [Desulfobacterales bacterium]|jgi:coenzyme F420-reducing hydrogenase delta subunit|nr:hydrogenase iron-sulfur subunit [Desulfobacterales bacterium]
MRLGYPSSIRIIRVPCTGKVDVLHILRCFERGADGVAVVGCREGDCHYQSGNFRAKKRVERARQILEQIGIGGDRVRMFNLSSSDAPMFVRFAQEIHAAVLSAGPNPIRAARPARGAPTETAARAMAAVNR